MADFQGTPRFQLLSRLGHGGAGAVYEVLDRERNVRVALKTLEALGPQALLRFKDEFRGMADLVHPNLVTLGELFCEDDVWFFTMELVEGVNFLAHVRPEGALHEGRLRPALVQLGRGLNALHATGRVHRDIKPSNLLVTAEGRVVLLDFGFVTAPGKPASAERVVGTIDYMAPEQARGTEVGPAADWYSVGVMLFEALTGALPFDGAPLEVLRKKQIERAPSAREPRFAGLAAPEDLASLSAELLCADASGRPNGFTVLRILNQRGSNRPFRPAVTQPGQASFVGRTAELAVLETALADSRQAPIMACIEGGWGLGKSALAARFVARARAAGAVVLSGRCHERESMPFKAVDGVIDALASYLVALPEAEARALLPRKAGYLATVFPVLARVPSIASSTSEPAVLDRAELRLRTFNELHAIMARIAAKRPLALVIDDLHWADPDGLALLAALLGGPDGVHALLVKTTRGPSPILARMDGMCQLRHITLGGLPRGDAAALARALAVTLGGQESSIDAEAIARDTEGQPLFIEELVRHVVLQRRRRVGVADTQPIAAARRRDTSEFEPPRGVEGQLEVALRSRVAQLGEGATRLLQVLACIGAPVEQELAASAVRANWMELGKHLGELKAAQLVRTDGARGSDKVEIIHERVRELVLALQSPAERVACHRVVANALTGHSRHDHEAIARHWLAAGQLERAAQHAERAAAEAAAALAFERAAALYRMALAPAGEAAGELARAESETSALNRKLGDVLVHAGKGLEAAAAYLAAGAALGQGMGAAGAGEGPGSGTGTARVRLGLSQRAAEQLLVSGAVDAGLDVLREVLAANGLAYPATSRQALTGLLWRRAKLRLRGLGFKRQAATDVAPELTEKIDACWSAAKGLTLIDTFRGAYFEAEHLGLALRAGEPYRVARALALEGGLLAAGGPGSRRRAEAVLAEARKLAEDIGSAHAQGLTQTQFAFLAYSSGSWRAARERAGVAEQLLRERCTGVAWELDAISIYGTWALAYLGRWRELGERIPQLLAAALARGEPFTATAMRCGISTLAWLARGDDVGALEQAEAARQSWSSRGFHLQHYYFMLSIGMIALYRGDGAGALAACTRDWSALQASQLLRVPIVRADALWLRGRALLAAGGQDRAQLGQALALARQVAQPGLTWTIPAGQLLEAGVRARRGQSPEALLARTAAGFDACEMPLHAAVARACMAEPAQRERGLGALAAEAIADPARVIAMLAPGFDATS